MPQTAKERDRRDALDATAADLRVAVPLSDAQAYWLREMVPFLEVLPARMHGGIVRYVLEGRQPGDFLTALVSNDLMEAVGRADVENVALLTIWCRLLHLATPSHCFGGRERVAAWTAIGGVAGAHPSVAAV